MQQQLCECVGMDVKVWLVRVL